MESWQRLVELRRAISLKCTMIITKAKVNHKLNSIYQFTHQNMKEAILQNIEINSQIIVFDQQSHQGQLIISNKHPTLGTVFKIKASKLNIIEVKPAKGYIKPQSKITINFKLTANMTSAQIQLTQKNDKFLIQFMNITKQEPSRDEILSFWAAYKNNTANLENGYGSYKVFMNLTGKKKLSLSDVKSSTTNTQLYQSVGRSIAPSNQAEKSGGSQDDEQLSTKYTKLKEKQEQLHRQRETILKRTPVKSKVSNAKSYLLLMLLFILAFLTGNYLRSSMVRVKNTNFKVYQNKNWFSSLTFLD